MAKRGPKGPTSSSFKKGQSGNPAGKPPGTKNERTLDFRQSVQKLLDACGPELEGWVARVAEKNPQRAMECLASIAEFATPKLSRVTHTGDADAPILFKQVTDDILNESPPPATDDTDQ